jgi:hypothetical protein
MDDPRIDGLARLLDQAGSRRTLASIVGGLLTGSLAVEATARTRSRKKRRKAQRAEKEAKPIQCAREGQKVTKKKECCPGLIEGLNGRCEVAPTTTTTAPPTSTTTAPPITTTTEPPGCGDACNVTSFCDANHTCKCSDTRSGDGTVCWTGTAYCVTCVGDDACDFLGRDLGGVYRCVRAACCTNDPTTGSACVQVCSSAT